MVEAAFADALKNSKTAISIEKKDKDAHNKLVYADWAFNKSIKRLDYDDFNANISLLLSNLEVV